MIYNFSFTSQKYVAGNTMNIETLKLCYGVIHKLDILFPAGCAGLVLCSVHSALHQIWPSNTDEYFSSDDEVISFREHRPLLTEPYSLELWHFNTDDTYNHSITVRIGILPVNVIAPWLLSYDERIAAALGSE